MISSRIAWCLLYGGGECLAVLPYRGALSFGMRLLIDRIKYADLYIIVNQTCKKSAGYVHAMEILYKPDGKKQNRE